MSLPATSDPAAMRELPRAREAERAALLELIPLQPGMRVLDLQAADGWLADGVRERLQGAVECLCVEPSAELNRRVSPCHRVVAEPVHAFPSVGDASVDAVLGLAGLHHSEDPRATLAECRRVLRPGGWLGLCDVVAGSAEARWLNGFVAEHHPGGHDGIFFAPAALAALAREAGFVVQSCTVRRVPWRFPDRRALVRFCRGLFGLAVDERALDRAIGRHLEVRTEGGEVVLEWSLAYLAARRPA